MRSLGSKSGNGAEHPLRVGIYSPFFGTTIGGGEKYLGVTAEAVRDAFPDADVEIMSPGDVDVDRYERMLDLDLEGIRVRSINRRANGFKRRLGRIPTLRLYRDLVVSAETVPETARYDLFISMVYVHPAFSRARRGVMLCQFPYERRLGVVGTPRFRGRLFDLYSRPYWPLRRWLFAGEIDGFELIITQSDYVRRWVGKLWARDSQVVNPPIDVSAEEPLWNDKQKIILSVGRFFAGGHSKRHDVMVRAFREMCDAGLNDWELHLVGSVQTDKPHDCEYFVEVVSLTSGYPVRLHVGIPGSQVKDLYRRASIYWHAAGYGVDEDRHPEELEHFGMTTAEAMAHGVTPVAIARGGQPEVVQDGVNGYLWTTTDELKQRTMELIKDPDLRQGLGKEARKSVARFSREQFKRSMIEALEPVVADLKSSTDDDEDHQSHGEVRPARTRRANRATWP